MYRITARIECIGVADVMQNGSDEKSASPGEHNSQLSNEI